MKRPGRRLTPPEIEVWRAVAETVSHRLPGATLPTVPAPEPIPVPRDDTVPVRKMPVLPGWSPPPQKQGIGPGTVERGLRKRVAAGRQPIEASLDLHGFRQAEAHRQLALFISGAVRDGARLVLIVTGKGRGDAEGRGVLRRLVPLWLADPRLAPMIVGFGEAGRGHGGEGALYVHLRSRTRRAPA